MTRPRASRVVAIGGGHGLACTLRALRLIGTDVTAIVSVADNGGSSGRLRRDHGIIAPGDVRRCLEALAPPSLFAETIGHRFESGDLAGHPVGNVVLAGLFERAASPVEAIETLARLLQIDGRVLPATMAAVHLIGETGDGSVPGQVAVSEAEGLVGVHWSPDEPAVPPAVLDAVLDSDLIVLGPGSLYTSVLAAVVPGVRSALRRVDARIAYVANLRPQENETSGYALADHVAAVLRHGVVPDVVIADTTSAKAGNSTERAESAKPAGSANAAGVPVVMDAIADAGGRAHDPTALARVLDNLLPAARR